MMSMTLRGAGFGAASNNRSPQRAGSSRPTEGNEDSLKACGRNYPEEFDHNYFFANECHLLKCPDGYKFDPDWKRKYKMEAGGAKSCVPVSAGTTAPATTRPASTTPGPQYDMTAAYNDPFNVEQWATGGGYVSPGTPSEAWRADQTPPRGLRAKALTTVSSLDDVLAYAGAAYYAAKPVSPDIAGQYLQVWRAATGANWPAMKGRLGTIDQAFDAVRATPSGGGGGGGYVATNDPNAPQVTRFSAMGIKPTWLVIGGLGIAGIGWALFSDPAPKAAEAPAKKDGLSGARRRRRR